MTAVLPAQMEYKAAGIPGTVATITERDLGRGINRWAFVGEGPDDVERKSLFDLSGEPDGTAWVIVAVTGVRDDVDDVIVPGAFGRTLREREAKGVMGHDWNRPVARADVTLELLPGDPRLPPDYEGPNGELVPWPAEAGALLIKAVYNLNTTDGRDAYEHARFYRRRTGYSIGYKVTPDGARHRGGVRYITDLDLYEFSPVLHGANRLATLVGIKSGELPGIEHSGTPDGGVDSGEVERKDVVHDAGYWGRPIGTLITPGMKPRGPKARSARRRGARTPTNIGTAPTAGAKPRGVAGGMGSVGLGGLRRDTAADIAARNGQVSSGRASQVADHYLNGGATKNDLDRYTPAELNAAADHIESGGGQRNASAAQGLRRAADSNETPGQTGTVSPGRARTVAGFIRAGRTTTAQLAQFTPDEIRAAADELEGGRNKTDQRKAPGLRKYADARDAATGQGGSVSIDPKTGKAKPAKGKTKPSASSADGDIDAMLAGSRLPAQHRISANPGADVADIAAADREVNPGLFDEPARTGVLRASRRATGDLDDIVAQAANAGVLRVDDDATGGRSRAFGKLTREGASPDDLADILAGRDYVDEDTAAALTDQYRAGPHARALADQQARDAAPARDVSPSGGGYRNPAIDARPVEDPELDTQLAAADDYWESDGREVPADSDALLDAADAAAQRGDRRGAAALAEAALHTDDLEHVDAMADPALAAARRGAADYAARVTGLPDPDVRRVLALVSIQGPNAATDQEILDATDRAAIPNFEGMGLVGNLRTAHARSDDGAAMLLRDRLTVRDDARARKILGEAGGKDADRLDSAAAIDEARDGMADDDPMNVALSVVSAELDQIEPDVVLRDLDAMMRERGVAALDVAAALERLDREVDARQRMDQYPDLEPGGLGALAGNLRERRDSSDRAGSGLGGDDRGTIGAGEGSGGQSGQDRGAGGDALAEVLAGDGGEDPGPDSVLSGAGTGSGDGDRGDRGRDGRAGTGGGDDGADGGPADDDQAGRGVGGAAGSGADSAEPGGSARRGRDAGGEGAGGRAAGDGDAELVDGEGRAGRDGGGAGAGAGDDRTGRDARSGTGDSSDTADSDTAEPAEPDARGDDAGLPDRDVTAADQPDADAATIENIPSTGRRFTPDATSFAPPGKRAKLDANMAALRTLRDLQGAKPARAATPAEQATLARWAGWGGLPEVFDEQRPEYTAERDELRGLLSDSEWNAARRNTLNAHYTDPRAVEAIWAAVHTMGAGRPGDRMLEPGSGSGNFIGYSPAGVNMVGVELDPTTAAISKYLYPDADIRNESFADSKFPSDAFDGVVGNVPFGQFALTDRAGNAGGHSIHNHFIIKSLRATRPGGIVAVLSSRYTMDSQDTKARAEMAQLGDLVGAVRLPTGSHRQASGTDVIEDVLIFRRRADDEAPQVDPTSWVGTESRVYGSAKPGMPDYRITLNKYWRDHPQDVLGKMRAEPGRYGTGDVTVVPAYDNDTLMGTVLSTHLQQMARTAVEDGLGATDRTTDAPELAGGDAGGRIEGHVAVHRVGTNPADWSFDQAVGGALVPFDVPAAQRGEVADLVELRDSLSSLLDVESRTAADTPEIAALRAQLNTRYDAYVAAYGPVTRYKYQNNGARKNPPAVLTFRRDPQAAIVRALESNFDPAGNDGKGSWSRATIFTRRSAAPREIRTTADTPKDALALSLETHGEIRMSDIAAMLGTSEEDARTRLGDLIAEPPRLTEDQVDAAVAIDRARALGLDEPQGAADLATQIRRAGSGDIQTAAEYMSGDVRRKLAAARVAAAADPRYAPLVSALEAVVPEDLGSTEVQARLGAAWIDPNTVRDFLSDLLDTDYAKVDKAGAMWRVEGPRYGNLSEEQWGTKDRSAPELVQALLEQRPIKITHKDPDTGKSVPDLEATLAAQAKAEAIAERFSEWVWEDSDRSRRLLWQYNNQFNNLALRSYDGTARTFPGMAAGFSPRPHQVAAVERIVNEPTALLAHVVGAGKTAEMVMGTAELKRLGMARKPAIVVPNHMLEQFTREYLEVYPNAKILAAGSDDLTGDKRKEFVGRAATGDWDAVILTQNAFEAIPMSPGSQAAYIDREISSMRTSLENARRNAQGEETKLVKAMEKALLSAEEALKKKLDKTKDSPVTFEQTGIDYLMVDEAHQYSNLRTLSNIPNAGATGSGKATDLHMKLDYLRERNQSNRVATFATGTPIRNTVTQTYIMQRFMRPDLLHAAGIDSFDEWAATFGQTVEEMELKPEGKGFRQSSRFAKFQNVPELLRMMHTFADVKMADDLRLPTPDLRGGRTETVTVASSDALAQFIGELGERAEKVRSGGVRPEDDNMLKISGDGRKAALSMKLVGRNHEPGKIETAADRIADIWKSNKDTEYPVDPKDPDAGMDPIRGGMQIVFMDLGTPKEAGKKSQDINDSDVDWNGYDALKAELVARGMAPGEIRYMHEAKNDAQKAELFAQARAGKIKVLIGSTEKMGVGTNVQRRAVALHHLDAPWRPSDVEQRDGRIMRQGNLNAEVQVVRYVTEGSFDAYMWQTLERKAKFIGQIMRGKLDVREMEDVGDTALSYAEVKALATGDPDLLDRAKVDTLLGKLERLDRTHAKTQTNLTRDIGLFTEGAAQNDRNVAAYDVAIGKRINTRGDAFAMRVPFTGGINGGDVDVAGDPNGENFTERAKAGEAAIDRIGRYTTAARTAYRDPDPLTVGTVGGHTLRAEYIRRSSKGPAVRLYFEGVPGDMGIYTPDEVRKLGVTQRAENFLADMNRARDGQAEMASYRRGQVGLMAGRVGAPFPKQRELDAARAKSRRLRLKMERDHLRSQFPNWTSKDWQRDADPELVAKLVFDPRIDTDEFDDPILSDGDNSAPPEQESTSRPVGVDAATMHDARQRAERGLESGDVPAVADALRDMGVPDADNPEALAGALLALPTIVQDRRLNSLAQVNLASGEEGRYAELRTRRAEPGTGTGANLPDAGTVDAGQPDGRVPDPDATEQISPDELADLTDLTGPAEGADGGADGEQGAGTETGRRADVDAAVDTADREARERRQADEVAAGDPEQIEISPEDLADAEQSTDPDQPVEPDVATAEPDTMSLAAMSREQNELMGALGRALTAAGGLPAGRDINDYLAEIAPRQHARVAALRDAIEARRNPTPTGDPVEDLAQRLIASRSTRQNGWTPARGEPNPDNGDTGGWNPDDAHAVVSELRRIAAAEAGSGEGGRLADRTEAGMTATAIQFATTDLSRAPGRYDADAAERVQRLGPDGARRAAGRLEVAAGLLDRLGIGEANAGRYVRRGGDGGERDLSLTGNPVQTQLRDEATALRRAADTEDASRRGEVEGGNEPAPVDPDNFGGGAPIDAGAPVEDGGPGADGEAISPDELADAGALDGATDSGADSGAGAGSGDDAIERPADLVEQDQQAGDGAARARDLVGQARDAAAGGDNAGAANLIEQAQQADPGRADRMNALRDQYRAAAGTDTPDGTDAPDGGAPDDAASAGGRAAYMDKPGAVEVRLPAPLRDLTNRRFGELVSGNQAEDDSFGAYMSADGTGLLVHDRARALAEIDNAHDMAEDNAQTITGDRPARARYQREAENWRRLRVLVSAGVPESSTVDPPVKPDGRPADHADPRWSAEQRQQWVAAQEQEIAQGRADEQARQGREAAAGLAREREAMAKQLDVAVNSGGLAPDREAALRAVVGVLRGDPAGDDEIFAALDTPDSTAREARAADLDMALAGMGRNPRAEVMADPIERVGALRDRLRAPHDDDQAGVADGGDGGSGAGGGADGDSAGAGAGTDDTTGGDGAAQGGAESATDETGGTGGDTGAGGADETSAPDDAAPDTGAPDDTGDGSAPDAAGPDDAGTTPDDAAPDGATPDAGAPFEEFDSGPGELTPGQVIDLGGESATVDNVEPVDDEGRVYVNTVEGDRLEYNEDDSILVTGDNSTGPAGPDAGLPDAGEPAGPSEPSDVEIARDDLEQAQQIEADALGLVEADDGELEVTDDVAQRQDRVEALVESADTGQLNVAGLGDTQLTDDRRDLVDELRLQEALRRRQLQQARDRRAARRAQSDQQPAGGDTDAGAGQQVDAGDGTPPDGTPGPVEPAAPKLRPGLAGSIEDLADAIETGEPGAVTRAAVRARSSLNRSRGTTPDHDRMRELLDDLTANRKVDAAELRTLAGTLRDAARARRNEGAKRRRLARKLERERLRGLLGQYDGELRNRGRNPADYGGELPAPGPSDAEIAAVENGDEPDGGGGPDGGPGTGGPDGGGGGPGPDGSDAGPADAGQPEQGADQDAGTAADQSDAATPDPVQPPDPNPGLTEEQDAGPAGRARVVSLVSNLEAAPWRLVNNDQAFFGDSAGTDRADREAAARAAFAPVLDTFGPMVRRRSNETLDTVRDVQGGRARRMRGGDQTHPDGITFAGMLPQAQRQPFVTAMRAAVADYRRGIESARRGAQLRDRRDAGESAAPEVAPAATGAPGRVGAGGRIIALAERPMADTPAGTSRYAGVREVAAHLREQQLAPGGASLGFTAANDRDRLVANLTEGSEAIVSRGGGLVAYRDDDTSPKQWHIVHTDSGVSLDSIGGVIPVDRVLAVSPMRQSGGLGAGMDAASAQRTMDALERMTDARGNQVDWTANVTAVDGQVRRWRDYSPDGSWNGGDDGQDANRLMVGAAVMQAVRDDPERYALSEAFGRASFDYTRTNGVSLNPARTNGVALTATLTDDLTDLERQLNGGRKRSGFGGDTRSSAQRRQDAAHARVLAVAKLQASSGQPEQAVAALRGRAEILRSEQHRDQDAIAWDRIADTIAELNSPEPTEADRLAAAVPGDRIVNARGILADAKSVPDIYEIVEGRQPVITRPDGTTVYRMRVRNAAGTDLTLEVDTADGGRLGRFDPDDTSDRSTYYSLPQRATENWAVVPAGQQAPATVGAARPMTRRAADAFYAEHGMGRESVDDAEGDRAAGGSAVAPAGDLTGGFDGPVERKVAVTEREVLTEEVGRGQRITVPGEPPVTGAVIESTELGVDGGSAGRQLTVLTDDGRFLPVALPAGGAVTVQELHDPAIADQVSTAVGAPSLQLLMSQVRPDDFADGTVVRVQDNAGVDVFGGVVERGPDGVARIRGADGRVVDSTGAHELVRGAGGDRRNGAGCYVIGRAGLDVRDAPTAQDYDRERGSIPRDGFAVGDRVTVPVMRRDPGQSQDDAMSQRDAVVAGHVETIEPYGDAQMVGVRLGNGMLVSYRHSGERGATIRRVGGSTKATRAAAAAAEVTSRDNKGRAFVARTVDSVLRDLAGKLLDDGAIPDEVTRLPGGEVSTQLRARADAIRGIDFGDENWMSTRAGRDMPRAMALDLGEVLSGNDVSNTGIRRVSDPRVVRAALEVQREAILSTVEDMARSADQFEAAVPGSGKTGARLSLTSAHVRGRLTDVLHRANKTAVAATAAAQAAEQAADAAGDAEDVAEKITQVGADMDVAARAYARRLAEQVSTLAAGGRLRVDSVKLLESRPGWKTRLDEDIDAALVSSLGSAGASRAAGVRRAMSQAVRDDTRRRVNMLLSDGAGGDATAQGHAARRLQAAIDSGELFEAVSQGSASTVRTRVRQAVRQQQRDATDYTESVRALRGALGDPRAFGQVTRTRYELPGLVADLEAGALTARTDSRLDGSADGGPGEVALKHLTAVRAAGEQVSARARALVAERKASSGVGDLEARRDGAQAAVKAAEDAAVARVLDAVRAEGADSYTEANAARLWGNVTTLGVRGGLSAPERKVLRQQWFKDAEAQQARLLDELVEASDAQRAGPQFNETAELAKARLEAVGEVVPMGPSATARGPKIIVTGLVDADGGALEREWRETILPRIPTAWLERTNDMPLRITQIAATQHAGKLQGRGHFDEFDERGPTVNIGEYTVGSWKNDPTRNWYGTTQYGQVLLHETGHYFEQRIPELRRSEWAHWRDRVSTGEVGSRRFDAPAQIEGYVNPEKAVRDGFADDYVGKVYSGDPGPNESYELWTMSQESLFAGSRYLDGDPDTEAWALGSLALLGGGSLADERPAGQGAPGPAQ